ncbi:MAG: hypothetical protein WC934_01975 [Acidithiobacillus sp.]|jgi:hypothetical protein|uniref:hypothetical protein n=1 Tax=Acidithiobacillus sp. TaxID=1872118 RepID=UPI00355FB014
MEEARKSNYLDNTSNVKSDKCLIIKKKDKTIIECPKEIDLSKEIEVQDYVWLPHIGSIYEKGFKSDTDIAKKNAYISMTVLFTTLAYAFGFALAYIVSDLIQSILSQYYSSYWVQLGCIILIFVPIMFLFVYLSFLYFKRITK